MNPNLFKLAVDLKSAQTRPVHGNRFSEIVHEAKAAQRTSKLFKRFNLGNRNAASNSSNAAIPTSIHIQHSQNASGFTREELEECRQVFSYFDADCSGSISKTELSEAMDRLGFDGSPADISQLVNEVDLDGNGLVDFDEFCLVMKKLLKQKQTNDDIIKSCFDVFDIDKNGVVTKAEFMSVFFHLQEDIPKDIVEEVFNQTDLDGSGKIDFDEFSQLVKIYLFDEPKFC